MTSVLSSELVTTFAGIAWDPHIRGVLAVLTGVAVLCGSVYLLLGTNLGCPPRFARRARRGSPAGS